MFEHHEEILENLKSRYPYIIDNMAKWESTGPSEVTVVLNNRTKVIYNDSSKSLYYFECKDGEPMNKDVWQREFSRKLCRIMGITGMSRKRLSELTGISEVSISKYTNAKASPSVYNIQLIANALHCSVSELFYF